MNRIYEDLSPAVKRARLAFLVIGGAFVLALLVYWKVQILDHRKYWNQSEANRTREVVLPAPRGVLTDRSGAVVLADNRAHFKASLIRENMADPGASYKAVAEVLELEESVVRARVARYADLPLFRPIVVKDDLDLKEVARIEARRLEMPELLVEIEPRRYYPFGSTAAHVLGFMQEATAEELQTVHKDRRLGDLVGKTGVEAAYQNRLAGVDGRSLEIVDSLGRPRGEIERVEPRQAARLALTIDYDLQVKAEEMLAGREGTIVAMDPRTGDILALASFPTYDPNKFINRFTPEEWMELIGNPEHPLLNRALQGLYSPGSTFKPVVAIAALESKVSSPATMFSCSGSVEIYGRSFHCWNEYGHGALALADAIRYSCNVYFYNIGRRLNIVDIAAAAATLGLGRKTGIDIPGEKEGLVPTPEWKKATQKADWYPGETISVAIGQGPLLVTPLQLAAATAAIANRGTRIRPRLTTEGGPPAIPEGPPGKIAPETFEAVIEGMWRSVNEGGTGQGARVDGLDACGKTGSAQTMSLERAEKISAAVKEKKTHSWFTGFGPRVGPRIVVTVLVEYGGMGGATAAPIAGQMFKIFREKHDRQGASARD